MSITFKSMAPSKYFCRNIYLVKPIYFFALFIFIFSAPLCAQTADTVLYKNDSLNNLQVKQFAHSVKLADTAKVTIAAKLSFKLKNKLLNTDVQAVSLAVQIKKTKSSDALFYLLAVMVLLLAFLKYFYSRYFTNLFRVFFNTSLRQNQITDQLLQAKLPSFLFNIFFVISAGIYIYVLLLHYSLFNTDNRWIAIFSSIALMALVYFIKFCTLKFTGWITGLDEVVNVYVFVIFLINKIIGIFLVPFIIILAFSDVQLIKIATLVSLICIGIFLLLRFYRSYGLVQNQLKISKFHFILYITSFEILPLMLIYKGLMIYLTKKL
jgi:hypothetical protein